MTSRPSRIITTFTKILGEAVTWKSDNNPFILHFAVSLNRIIGGCNTYRWGCSYELLLCNFWLLLNFLLRQFFALPSSLDDARWYRGCALWGKKITLQKLDCKIKMCAVLPSVSSTTPAVKENSLIVNYDFGNYRILNNKFNDKVYICYCSRKLPYQVFTSRYKMAVFLPQAISPLNDSCRHHTNKTL